jgi:hypothetical protein
MPQQAYATAINERLEAMGRRDVSPVYVEGWMRVEHPTLDGLSREQFTEEVAMAVACVDASTDAENRSLAQSYGLERYLA